MQIHKISTPPNLSFIYPQVNFQEQGEEEV